tara:strand:+ start:657 stop:1568 length:912 start_codon:yes stop_codon:yes gene_type:complete
MMPDALESFNDLPTLMQSLLAGAASSRGHPEGAGMARLLEAAAQALQQQVAEAKVQRGLAIASQTLAAELSVRCEQLQARLDSAGVGQNGAPPLHDATEATPALPVAPTPPISTPSAWPGGASAVPQPGSCYAPAPQSLQAHQMQQLQQLQAQQQQLQQQMQSQQAQAQAPPRPQAPAVDENDAAGRLTPRSFKTWTPDPAAPPQASGGALGGGLGSSASSGSIGGGANREEDAAERAVSAMVDNLKQRFRQSGVTLPLEKHSGTVYRLGAKKLTLNIRSSRLMVRVGGGYCDFLEYLSKASI